MKAQILIVLVVGLLSCGNLTAQEKFPPSSIDYDGFAKLTQEVGRYRQQRLVDLDTFQRMAAEEGTLVLDCRSAAAFKRKHFAGAVNLPFSDFTTDSFAQTIPSKVTRVLIYCNNNIKDDAANFPTKRVELALNIPTFVNLYGYGYENIYELSELIPADHAALVFEGTSVRLGSVVR